MKKFLLIALITLPALALAQPTLTFTPLDGATNVSTTSNLLIKASEGIKQIGGGTLDNTNIDDLITIVDTDMNEPVSDATIDPSKKDITITLATPLSDLTTYTLTFEPVENGAGDPTATQTITFTTGNFNAPVFLTSMVVNNTGSGFEFVVNVNEAATVYYIVDQSATPPSSGQIKLGDKSDGNDAELAGSFSVTPNTDITEIISGLDFTTPVKFYVHYFAEDAASNGSAPALHGIPLLKSSAIPPASINPTGFDLRVQLDEVVTTYYVVTESSTVPTAAQILSGQNESGGAPVTSGSFAVASANADTDHTITGLDDVTTYYVHFVSVDGSGNQTIVQSHTATTPDGTPPVVTTLSPADGTAGVDITTSTFTITFNENISTINIAPGGDEGRIRLFEEGIEVKAIDRNDAVIGTTGAVIADGTSTTATITFLYDLLPNKNYHIIIGEDVFEDNAGNDFAGYLVATDWNFSTSGVIVNNASSNICSGSFQSIGNIIISETFAGDFNTGAGQTLILSLGNTSEFAFSNSGVNVAATSSDITSLSVSVGLTSITVTYTVASETVVDAITISGLKVYATGAAASTTVVRTGGSALQDGNDGTGASSLTHATINVGATAPAPPQLAGSQDLIHCVDEDLTTKNLELVDQGASVTYKWYSDASLSTLVFSSDVETVNLATDLDMVSPAVAGTYKFYLVAASTCQSAPAVEVALQVSANPVADAGADRVGTLAVCTGTELTLGGNPTLAVPSAPGTYTYAWEYIESTPEPDPVANPTVTVTNASTTAAAMFNYRVTITDENGCVGTDMTTVEVKSSFNISLISPNSYTFTPNAPNQTLQASPLGGTFSGVGVVQSNTPSTYQFSPAIAHATDPTVLPKSFNIYYTVSKDGCTVTNHHIATFTIANSFFSSLQPEYCGDEYPNSKTGGVVLSLDNTGYTYVDNRKTSWNNSERFSRGPYNNPWQSLVLYANGAYVRYNNEIYRCNTALGCTGLVAPSSDPQWVYENILKVDFKGYIGNYYEDYYGGNDGTTTITKLASTYTVGGRSFNHYQFATNVNYKNCSTCNYAWPAAYLEFERPEDIQLMLPQWNSGYYFYRGDLVTYAGNVYQCTANPYTIGTQPDGNPLLWTPVTGSNYSNGQYFHKFDTAAGAFRSGFYVNGQYVQINRNPTVFFSGLANADKVCQFEVLNLDNAATSAGISYNLTGNFLNQNFAQQFFVKLDGSGVYNDGGGAIVNDIINPGRAKLDTKLAFGVIDGSTSKNVEIMYQVDPGTTGSLGQSCYGTSSIVVQVLQNSNFDFDDNVVNNDGTVYCYTEAAKGLQSEYNGTPISGATGAANSVTYTGDGVNNLGNSLGVFRPGLAVDQISPGTTVQQSVPITATYRDANQCRSSRVRTFKVNPDIQPSFTFGGRANYCYEDIANNFTGHFEDFTINGSTVTSTGRYDFRYTDPGGNNYTLQTVNTNNTAFTAQTFYDQIQGILTAGSYTTDLNQTVNLNVWYTEIASGCFESVSQTMVISPPAVLDIFGLTAGDLICRNDNANVSQGNVVTFEGSVSGSGIFKLDDDNDFTATNPTLNGTVNTNAGKATINLLTAYNAALDSEVFLQYEYTAPGCTGAAEVVKSFTISPPPPLGFTSPTPDNATIFCNNDPVIQLQTSENTNVILTGYGVTDSGTGNGSATFDPQLAFNTSVSNGGSVNSAQNILVTARIVDAIGCANVNTVQYTVNPIPAGSVDIDADELNYCYEDDPRLITGTQTKSWYTIDYIGVTTPYTDNIGSLSSPQRQFTFDPRARFDQAINLGASALSPVNFNVYYTIADAQNCTNTLGPYTLAVANQIEVSIAGLEDQQIYCSNESDGVKVLTFNPFPADASKRMFTINGQSTPLGSDKYSFNPGQAGGDFELRYSVISGNNCTNTDTTRVKALPSPVALFSVSPACKDDLIDYNANGTGNLASAVYTWTFSGEVKTGQNVQHTFPGVSSYYAKLKVEHPAYAVTPTQSLVCSDSLQLDQIVGPYPEDIDFTFSNVCENDETTFEVTSTVPINRVSWDFGDAEITDFGILSENISTALYPNSGGTYQHPIHRYGGANDQLTVRVYGKTSNEFGGCETQKERIISILKRWTPTASEPIYDMSQINNGNGGWVVEDQLGNATWEFNVAAKDWINTEEMAWVTGATLPYNANDVSYVNSPCFDLTGFTRPVISINHWADTEASDGAVLQYSTDGGASWKRLGDVASGLEWYNKLTISSNPGNQDELSSGWSLSNQENWAVGKHTLDVLTGPRDQVRFRVAFSSFNNREQRDGFAFNHVVIEERNRTILVENFTTLNPEQADNNTIYRNFRATDGVFNPAELVKLQYHHASAQNPAEHDVLYQVNPTDQNARAAFYGVTNPVRAFIDGGFGQTSTNATFESPDLTTYFGLRSLVTSPVQLSIDFETEPSDKLNVKATVQAMNDIGGPGEYNVFIAIAEQDTLGQSYVLRKFLPHAAGTPLTSLAATDPPQEIFASYDMRHVTRRDNGEFAPFAVIVFVQNLQTKDVLQTVMRQDGTASGNVVTGVETPFDNMLRMYPNPADDVLNIILPAPVRQATPVRLFDNFGKEAFSGTFQTGEHMKSLSTKGLSAGVYLLQLSTPEGVVRKKAIVVHD